MEHTIDCECEKCLWAYDEAEDNKLSDELN